VLPGVHIVDDEIDTRNAHVDGCSSQKILKKPSPAPPARKGKRRGAIEGGEQAMQEQEQLMDDDFPESNVSSKSSYVSSAVV